MSGRFKTRESGWWPLPPDMPLNASVPYIVAQVDPGLCAGELRILALFRKFGQQQDDKSWTSCRPGSFVKIGRRLGMWPSTVWRYVTLLEKKRVIERRQIWQGKRRVVTVYTIRPYARILADWKTDPDLWHTTDGRIAVIGRLRRQVTLKEGAALGLDAAKAPKAGRGYGRPDPERDAIAKTRVSLPQADIVTVYQKLQWAGAKPAYRHAAALIRIARTCREAEGAGEDVTAEIISQLIGTIARDYKGKRSEKYPEPRPGWFLQEMPRYIGEWRAEMRARARTG